MPFKYPPSWLRAKKIDRGVFKPNVTVYTVYIMFLPPPSPTLIIFPIFFSVQFLLLDVKAASCIEFI